MWSNGKVNTKVQPLVFFLDLEIWVKIVRQQSVKDVLKRQSIFPFIFLFTTGERMIELIVGFPPKILLIVNFSVA